MISVNQDDDHCDGHNGTSFILDDDDHDDDNDDDVVERMLPEMPLLPITSPSTIEACRSLPVNEYDIFICSYPKSGTTWTQNLVVRLLAANVGMTLPDDWHLSHSAPFYEVDRYWQCTTRATTTTTTTNDDDLISTASCPMERVPARTPIQTPAPSSTATTTTSSSLSSNGGIVMVPSLDGTIVNDNTGTPFLSYRVFNTHLRPHQLPAHAKCIYVMRDPLDVLVSFYHHLIHMVVDDGGYGGSAQEFGQDFVDGRILYGKWEDHIEAWLGRKYKKDGIVDGSITTITTPTGSSSEVHGRLLLLLHYQDMKNDLSYETARLAKFLGVQDDRLQKVVSETLVQCTFDAMKAECWRYTPRSVEWRIDPRTGRPYDDFVRSGNVGEGRADGIKGFFTPTLEVQWKEAIRTAKRRWQKAGVDNNIIERYLTAE
jgi:hypothetical protein